MNFSVLQLLKSVQEAVAWPRYRSSQSQEPGLAFLLSIAHLQVKDSLSCGADLVKKRGGGLVMPHPSCEFIVRGEMLLLVYRKL